MSTFFRGITEIVPSLFRGIFSEGNSVPNPSQDGTSALFLPATAGETLCVGAGVVVTAAFVVVPGTVQHKELS
jgi:hypothetical protein